jgi:hypothetical protein
MLRFVSLVETISTHMCATRHRENLESKMNNSVYDVQVRWYKNLAIRHYFVFRLELNHISILTFQLVHLRLFYQYQSFMLKLRCQISFHVA